MENSNPLDKYPTRRLSELIEIVDEKGKARDAGQIEGVNIEKCFTRTVANLEMSDLSKYKTVPANAFACNLMHIGRDVTVPVAFNSQKRWRIVSPAYTVFKVRDEEELMPIFLFTQLNSKEFNRKLWFNTDGSVRGNLTWEDMCRVKIPLPPIEVQRVIVALYTCAEEARKIAAEAKEVLKKACPAMVQSAAHHKTGVI